MKVDNICKFPSDQLSNDVFVSCFVLESDAEIMRKKNLLAHNRMILVEQGEGDFSFDDNTFSFAPGSLIFGFEGEYFSLLQGENVRYLYIDFGGTRAQNLCHRLGIYPHSRNYENMHSLIPFFKECLLSTPTANIDIVAESVLLYVFSKLSVGESKQNSTIQKIIQLTELHFRDPNLSMVRIADDIGYNAKYLSHFFKKKMNISYTDYLRSFRFKYAISLFELGISSVKNVAFLSGFSDPFYFSNAFKKEIGISPKEFIRKQSEQKEK